MEPVWLGLATPSILSTAGNLANAAVRPFAAALERATDLLTGSAESEPAEELSGAPRDSLSTILDGLAELGASLADLEDHADDLNRSLGARISNMLEAAGISTGNPLQLRLSAADGQLEVVGHSDERALVEATLASDPTIAAEFQELSALHALLNAAEEHADFAEAYARDPLQAVHDYAPLMDGSEGPSWQATLDFSELSFQRL